MTPIAVAVVPAAGSSTRFGTMKLLADVGGAPLLERTLTSLLDAGVARVVVVTRAGDAFEAVPSMADPRVTAVVNPDPARGMFSSIQAGLAVAGGDVVLVLPADMPFVTARTVGGGDRARRGHGVGRGARARGPARTPDRHPETVVRHAAGARADDDAQGRAVGVRSVDGPARRADPGVLRDVDVPADLGR